MTEKTKPEDNNVVVLSKPVNIPGSGDVDKLKLKAPSISAFNRLGRPIRLHDDGTMSFDSTKLLEYLEDMTGHAMAHLEHLSIPDRIKCEDAVFNFFS